MIAALQGGASIEEAADRAEEFAGEPVDVVEFVETLRELGFVDDGERAPIQTAPVQGRRWLRGLWLGGLFVVAAWLGFFVLPVAKGGLLEWTALEMAAGPGAWRFWYALACAAVLLGPWVAAAGLALKERISR